VKQGRRVIVAVTDGRDGGSSFTWNQVREDAQFSSLSVFGLTNWQKALRIAAPATERLEFPFYQICGTTGGVIATTSSKSVEHDLQRFAAMVRARYILEFPRARNASYGLHSIDVRIDHPDAIIRAAGTTYNLASQKELEDQLNAPGTPGASDQAPEEGKRRIMTSPH
jgi:hypothetical protein